jgi:hypothetical protein
MTSENNLRNKNNIKTPDFPPAILKAWEQLYQCIRQAQKSNTMQSGPIKGFSNI